VGNLAWLAIHLIEEDKTRPAGEELLRQHITPNLHLANILESNNVCGWRHSLLAIRRSFLKLKDYGAAEECLHILSRHSDREGDDEMAVYLYAYQLAGQEKYNEAVEALQRLPQDSKWANQNPALIKIWSKSQQALENRLKQQAVKDRIKASKAPSGEQ